MRILRYNRQFCVTLDTKTIKHKILIYNGFTRQNQRECKKA